MVPGETGHLIPVGDRFEFTRLTHWILEDEAKRRRMGEAGRERVQQHFTIRQMIDGHAQLYRELAQR